MVIRTVVCPLDFSALSARELELATDLCRAVAARLVPHHNMPHAAPGAATRRLSPRRPKPRAPSSASAT